MCLHFPHSWLTTYTCLNPLFFVRSLFMFVMYIMYSGCHVCQVFFVLCFSCLVGSVVFMPPVPSCLCFCKLHRSKLSCCLQLGTIPMFLVTIPEKKTLQPQSEQKGHCLYLFWDLTMFLKLNIFHIDNGLTKVRPLSITPIFLVSQLLHRPRCSRVLVLHLFKVFVQSKWLLICHHSVGETSGTFTGTFFLSVEWTNITREHRELQLCVISIIVNIDTVPSNDVTEW